MHFNPIAILKGLFLRRGGALRLYIDSDPPAFIGLKLIRNQNYDLVNCQSLKIV